MTPRSPGGTAVVVAGVVACAPAAWWLSGWTANDIEDPDYLLRPLELPAGAELAIGLASLALVAVAFALLVGARQRHEVRREWWGVILPAAAVAAYVGLTYRVMTAPVIGANIGGGMMIFGAAPVVISMAVVAAMSLRNLRRPTSGL